MAAGIADNAFYDGYVRTFYVAEGGYGEQYAEENGISYAYADGAVIVPAQASGEEREYAGGQWTYILEGGGVTITDFSDKEYEGVLEIPNELDGHPVTGIGAQALAFSRMTGVTIPDSVTSIGSGAFFQCVRLTDVTVPDSVAYIGGFAFHLFMNGPADFVPNDKVTLCVMKDSYAEQYAKSNGIPYVFIAESAGAAEFHYQRGVALFQLSRDEEAEQAFAKAVEIEPDNAEYLCYYGFTMAWFNGKLQEGYEALDKAVTLEPFNGGYISDRGAVLYLMGRIDEAVSEQKRAIEIDPEYSNAYYFIAMAHYDLGEYEEAARNCEENLEKAPGGYNAMVLLGDSRFMLGQTAEALAAYDEAITYGYYTAASIKNYAAAQRTQTAAKAGEVFTDSIEEITVGTAEELLAALGSNRRILLREGVYNLTAAASGFESNGSIYFKERDDGLTLYLDPVSNLTIEGIGDSQSEIVVEPRYGNVITFCCCENIRIVNIKAGHTDGEACEGSVFAFDQCEGIYIDNTDMYGCGLFLGWTEDVKVDGSTIRGCTENFLSVYESSDILFANCVFRDNTGCADIQYSSNVTIDSCSFLRNTDEDYALLYLFMSENVTVKNTEFIDNDTDGLIDQYNSGNIVIDASNRYENNSFGATATE